MIMRALRSFRGKVGGEQVFVFRGQFRADDDPVVVALPDEFEELPGQPESGGSQPNRVTVTDVSFDDPALAPITTAYPITAVDQGAKKFTIAGDHSKNQWFVTVSGSTGNDGSYTVAHVALVDGDTVFTVNESVPDTTADGDLAIVTGGGLTIYTPVAGDIMLYQQGVFSITEAWDGSNPRGHLMSNYSDVSPDLPAVNLIDMTSVNTLVDGGTTIEQINGAVIPSNQWAILFPDTIPLKFFVDDGAGGDPGSAQGAGTWTIGVVSAP